MKKYESDSRKVSARPRSKRLRQLGTGGTASGGVNVSVSGTGEGGDDGWKDLIQKDNESGFLRILRTVKGFFLGERERYADDIATSEDWETEGFEPTDTMLVTAKAVRRLSGDLEGKYIRKDQEDETPFLVRFLGGLSLFKFVKGMIGGAGAAFFQDEAGKSVLEVDRIHAREELIVPQITFNNIDVVQGELVQTFAYGTILSVDTAARTAELELLDGETASIHVADICRGVFHNLGGGNEPADASEDGNGFLRYAGFSTSYFSPSDILVSKPGRCKFRYSLQPGTSTHPMKGMKFFAYGNFVDRNRQSVTYLNRRYRRMLSGVDTWVINPDKHIKLQDGDLNGLVIGGQSMSDYSSYLHNIYMTGVVIQFTPQQQEELKGDAAYTAILSDYEGVARIAANGDLSTAVLQEGNVTSVEGNVVTGGRNVTARVPALHTTIMAYRGSTPLEQSDSELGTGTYIVGLTCVGCRAEASGGLIRITELTSTEACWVEAVVNCEGKASFVLRYTVSFVRNGLDGSFKSTVFHRQNTTPSAPSGGTYEHPVPDGWSDGIPAGEAILWASVCTFFGDGSSSGWSQPRQMTDTADFDVEFSSVESPSAPTGHPNTNSQWSNAAGEDTIWMATSTKKNGVWSEWEVSKIKGEKGEDGISGSFKSTVFHRQNTTPSAPSGGTYEHPVPDGWSDGIPAGEAILWASVCTFFGDGSSSGWSQPRQMTDTADFDVEFSSETSPSAPTGHPNTNSQWSNAAGEDTIWMATSTKKNGVWSAWQIFKTRGEDGKSVYVSSVTTRYAQTATYVQPSESELGSVKPEPVAGHYIWTVTTVTYSDGTQTQSMTVVRNGSDGADGKGVTITSTSVRYCVTATASQPEDGAFVYSSVPSLGKGDYLWTRTIVTYSDGTQTQSYSVSRIGADGADGMPGAAGEDGATSYLHIAYASSEDGKDGFSLAYFAGAAYIGLYTDFAAADSTDYTRYTWSRLRGEDGTSPVFADLDNEMDAVACDADGAVTGALPLTTNVSLWCGIQRLSIDSITLNKPSGVTATADASTGVVSVTAITKAAADTLPVGITLQSTYKGVTYTRELVFTVNKVRPGKDGADANLLKLVPNTAVIRRTAAGGNVPVSTFCYIQACIAGVSKTYTSSLPEGCTLKRSVDGGSYTDINPGDYILSSTVTERVEYSLYYGDKLMDRETVLVVSDGQDGEKGDKGDKGDTGAAGTDGTDGKDGANAKYYTIEASVSVIGVTSTGSYSPFSFIVSEYTINGANKTSSNVNYIHVYGIKDGTKSSRLTYSASVNQWTFNAATYQDSDYDAFVFELWNSSSTTASNTVKKLSSCTVGVARRGDDGAQGPQGPQGPTGPTGPTGSAGPMGATLRPRGLYSSSSTYVYNSEFRDCVYDSSGNVWMVRTYGDSITGSTPSSSNSRWLQGNKAIFTAIDTALIDNANIAGFLYSNQKMMSADKKSLILDGINGEITAINGNIGGLTLTSDSIGTVDLSSGSVRQSMLSLGKLHIVDTNRGTVSVNRQSGTVLNVSASISDQVSALHVSAVNAENRAIEASGSCVFSQGLGSIWKMPGVLYAAAVSASGSIITSWGDGLASGVPTSHSNVTISKSSSNYTITHNLGHSQYVPFAQADASSNQYVYAAIKSRTSNSFVVQTRTGGGSNNPIDAPFFFVIIGKNKS